MNAQLLASQHKKMGGHCFKSSRMATRSAATERRSFESCTKAAGHGHSVGLLAIYRCLTSAKDSFLLFPFHMMDDFVSRTGSSRGVLKQNGEIIAKPHPVMKKSYAGNKSATEGKDACVRWQKSRRPHRSCYFAHSHLATRVTQHDEGRFQGPKSQGSAYTLPSKRNPQSPESRVQGLSHPECPFLPPAQRDHLRVRGRTCRDLRPGNLRQPAPSTF